MCVAALTPVTALEHSKAPGLTLLSYFITEELERHVIQETEMDTARRRNCRLDRWSVKSSTDKQSSFGPIIGRERGFLAIDDPATER